MEKALINIFKKDEPPTRNVQITGFLSNGMYQAVDAYGRPWVIQSDQKLKINDFVRIQNNVVLNKTSSFGKTKNFFV